MGRGNFLVGRSWRHLRLGALLMCLAVSQLSIVLPASAQEPEMRFVVVRSSQGGCEPTCPEWISAEGVIGPKTPALLKATLKTLGGRKLPLVLASSGGDMAAAMAIGRLIRKNRLSVAVGTTIFVGCKRDEENCTANEGKGADYLGGALPVATCADACTLVLASGNRRLSGVDATVRGVPITAANEAATKKLVAYYGEMGVRYEVLAKGELEAGGDYPLWQSFKALLITSTLAVDQLVDAQICRGAPAPDNCRVFTTMDLE